MFDAIAQWWRERKAKRRDALRFEREVVVAADESGVSVMFASGQREEIAWSDVRCVAVETNDSGPWGADVWWLLEGLDSKVVYPQGATGDEQMLELLPTRFPGFRHEAVVRAMGCTSNQRFVCWESSDGL